MVVLVVVVVRMLVMVRGDCSRFTHDRLTDSEEHLQRMIKEFPSLQMALKINMTKSKVRFNELQMIIIKNGASDRKQKYTS